MVPVADVSTGTRFWRLQLASQHAALPEGDIDGETREHRHSPCHTMIHMVPYHTSLHCPLDCLPYHSIQHHHHATYTTFGASTTKETCHRSRDCRKCRKCRKHHGGPHIVMDIFVLLGDGACLSYHCHHPEKQHHQQQQQQHHH